MDKLDMHTPDKVDGNINKIGIIFPNCITETLDENGKPIKAIDFDMLKQELSKVVVDGPKERYQFTWPDKKKSMLLANSPISATLRPVRTESFNFDSTGNLYIEGDNLDVLKLLQETYLGKVKMIYIDPPYNTGNDFVYEDDFDIDADTFKDMSGDYDEQGNRLRKNNDTNGRFHTDWLNMIYPRLKLARDLLKDDGVIFISIDENEIENLKKIAMDIFGETNLIGTVIWERAFAPKNDAKYLSDSHDYIVICAKNLMNFKIGLLPRTQEADARYKNPDNDPKGPWTPDNMTVKTYSAAYDYEIVTPNGSKIKPVNGRCWFTSRERMTKLISEGKVWFGEDGGNMPRIKRYLSDVQNGMTSTTIWKYVDVGHNQEGRQELKKLFDDNGFFDGPKPLRLMQRILTLANTDKDNIILDFFSGSATTAHAVMQLNAEDGGKRKFIMVQIPEATDESSEAFKAGYKNICEIGKERIRRAGKKVKEEAGLNGQNLDIGFRVLKLDSSNMKNVYYSPEEYVNEPGLFDQVHDNIKEDRSGEDLLFQIMLDLGIELSADIKTETITGKNIYTVKDNYLVACFDTNVTDELLTGIAKRKPFYAVLRDSSFTRDDTASNFEQIFATWSPETIKKVL